MARKVASTISAGLRRDNCIVDWIGCWQCVDRVDGGEIGFGIFTEWAGCEASNTPAGTLFQICLLVIFRSKVASCFH